MAKLTVTVTDWRPLQKNTLRGFAKIKIDELDLVISEIGIHESHGRRWAALPSRPWISGLEVVTDDAGKIRYSPVIEFVRKETRDAFSARVVEALARFDPNALVLESAT